MPPAPQAADGDFERFLQEKPVAELNAKLAKSGKDATRGFRLGDRVRQRKRGRGNNAHYGLIVHIKPDATNKKTPEVSVLWRCADGKDDLTLVEDSHELDKLLGYRNAFRDVHADVDKPAPPLTFDYSYLVSIWYASFLSFATVQPVLFSSFWLIILRPGILQRSAVRMRARVPIARCDAALVRVQSANPGNF